MQTKYLKVRNIFLTVYLSVLNIFKIISFEIFAKHGYILIRKEIGSVRVWKI